MTAESIFHPIARRGAGLRATPQIVPLWMERVGARTVRIELRIDAPAASPDWTLWRIEWLEPVQAGISDLPDGRPRRVLDVRMRPGDEAGRWFEGDASLWVRYAGDHLPAHRVGLRLHFETGRARRTTRDVEAVFPALGAGGEILAFPARLDGARSA